MEINIMTNLSEQTQETVTVEETTEQVKVETATESDETKAQVTKQKRGPKAKTAATGVEVTEQPKAETTAAVEVDYSESADTTAPSVGIFKLNAHTKTPTYGTKASACFDIRVNFLGEFEDGQTHLSAFTKQNQPIKRKLEKDNDGRVYVELRPYERLIAPTGAIFDIPEGYSLKAHPRSGTSLKQGINLINQEAVIDSDYVEELKLLLVNDSEAYVKIYHDERYAQGELQEVIQNQFVELTERPSQKTDRTGGLGHTGKK